MRKKCVTQDIALLRETSIPNLPNLDMIFNLRLNYSPFTPWNNTKEGPSAWPLDQTCELH